MNKLILPNGATYGYGANGQRICTGSQMGRSNIMPSKPYEPIKLRMERLRWVSGDYDQFGAYWGNSGDYIYCAHGHSPTGDEVKVFVRGHCRHEAKRAVREKLPKARFYR